MAPIRDEAEKLPALHDELLHVFSGVANRYDEEAYARHLADEAVRAELARLASGLEAMLRVQGLGARRITLKLRFDDERTLTRSRTLVRSVSQRQEIEAEAAELLARADVGSRPVRLVGLLLARLGRSRRDGRQLELFRPAG